MLDDLTYQWMRFIYKYNSKECPICYSRHVKIENEKLFPDNSVHNCESCTLRVVKIPKNKKDD